MGGDQLTVAVHLQMRGVQLHPHLEAGEPDRHRVPVGAHRDLTVPIHPQVKPAAGLERCFGQRHQQRRLHGEQFTDGADPGTYATVEIVVVPFVDHGVEFGGRFDLRHRHEVVAAKLTDLAFHPTLLMSALHSRLAVKRLCRVVGPKRHPAIVFHPMPRQTQHR